MEDYLLEYYCKFSIGDVEEFCEFCKVTCKNKACRLTHERICQSEWQCKECFAIIRSDWVKKRKKLPTFKQLIKNHICDR